MKEETIKVEASIIDSPHEMIIGRETIKAHVLALKLHTQFFTQLSDAKAVLVGLGTANPGLLLHQQHITTKTVQPDVPSPGDVKDKSELLDEVTVDDGVEARWERDIPYFPHVQAQLRKSEVLGYSEEEIRESKMKWAIEEGVTNGELDVLDVLYIHKSEGNEDFVRRQRVVFEQNRHVLSKYVHPDGASVPPFRLNVNPVWEKLQSAKRPREMNAEKQRILKEQIDHMVAHKIIRKTDRANKCSHALLVTKPDKSWRFCMDFRELNEHTSNDGMTWPISRIDELIRRLGASGSKYFGVIDLTAGYHQMSLLAS
jgi:hypothetical protein